MRSIPLRGWSVLIAGTFVLAACASERDAVRAGAARPVPTVRPVADATGGADAAAPAASAPDLGGAPTLATLLRTALTRSPIIMAARARALAAAEGAAIESALPNPQLLVGWYETAVETRVGSQEWSVGIRQAIPFPTKLSTKADIENSEARRMRVAYERVARDVLVEVVKTAHEIAYIDEAVQVTAQIEGLLERYATAAAAKETNSLVSELFRAETQRAQLQNDRITLVELRVAEAQRMRSLLDLPADAEMGTPVVGDTPVVRTSIPELLEVAERHNQELREAGVALETARLRSSLAEQRHVPDMSVGVTSIRTDRLPSSLGMNPDGNGDDPLIFSLGVTLPIWLQSDAAAIRRARALERAASLERLDAIQKTRDRVARAWFEAGNTARLAQLYADVLVPRAAVAARTAEDLLASGKGNLGGVLETIAVFHNFRLAAARARADHGRAVAELERAIGQPFSAEDGVAAPVPGDADSEDVK